MAKAIKLNTFGSQALTNATTLKQEVVEDSADTPVDSLMLDANSTWYDADGSTANTTIPGIVTCEIKVSGTSAANFKTNTNAIEALNGTKATLTAAYADATTVTCTARCRVEPVTIGTDSFLIPMARYRLTFQKTTSWA